MNTIMKLYRLVDIIRASIVVDTEEELMLIAEALRKLKIVRLKNRKFVWL